jgi:DnaK suppressor protein
MLVRGTMSKRGYRLLQETNRVRKELQPINSWCAADYGGDIADQASHTVELLTSEAWHRLCQQKLKQLERARARLGAGQYGICESCGKGIDPARLKVMPSATRCVNCQRQSERQNHHDSQVLHGHIRADQGR